MQWNSGAHPISDVWEWSHNNRLELQPDFQRNEVWTKAAQIALIDTILKNIPIPKIYMKSLIKNKQTYRIVIDGQQRLTAILAFLENKLKLKTPHISNHDYDGMTFDSLPHDIQTQVLSYKIDFNEIIDPSDEELRDLYARVNKYTVQLNKQELRRADFPGEFLSLAEDLSDLEFFADNKLFSSGQKRRMLDVEYIEELLCIVLEGEQDKKDSLDDFCERYSLIPQGINIIKDEFQGVLDDIEVIFADGISLSGTRFRQHADFYSFFGCIIDFKRAGKIIINNQLDKVRRELAMLDKEIAPLSESDRLREYAIRCISDANSISTRTWRKEFLNEYLKHIYIPSMEGDD